MFAKNGLRVKAKEPRNHFDSGPSLSWPGVEGATEVAEREETADAVGVVGDGAVADSTVVVGAYLSSMALGSNAQILSTEGWQTFPQWMLLSVAASRQLLLHFRTFPSMSVELVRYRCAAKDGGTLEYVFDAGEQNSPNANQRESG